MSRAERRAYKRMTKNQDPYAVPGGPGAKAKLDRQRARRQERRKGEFSFITTRFLVWLLGGAAIAALLGFSVAWPNGMPMAAYVGLAVAAGWLLLAFAFRAAQRRAASIQR